jgi:uncharacterized coiled-coil protein SlyX
MVMQQTIDMLAEMMADRQPSRARMETKMEAILTTMDAIRRKKKNDSLP